LPILEHPWWDILIDFVTGLPTSDGFYVIWVVVDCLTKLRYFALYSNAIDTKGLAKLFLSNIFHLHGLPDTILSDQGPQFALRLWKHQCNSLKIELCQSIAFHPETDRQTEQTKAIME
jgi:hypothetical protein